MSTYLYTYASSSSREMLAKYDSGYIYDCRKSRYESSAQIIAKDQNGYLCKSTRASYEYTDIYVNRNVLYRKGTGYSDTLLIAKDGIIYSYQGYTTKNELATYSGRSGEALLAYAALYYMGSSTSYSGSGVSSNQSNTETNSSSGGGGNAGGNGCSTFFIWGSLFVMGAVITTLIEYYPYYTYFHVAVSIALPLGILLKRLFSDKEYRYTTGSAFLGAITGAITAVVIIFFGLLIDTGFIKYMSDGRKLIVSYDTAYSCVFIASIIIGILLSAEEKK